MLIRNIEEIPSFPYGEGASKRVIFGDQEKAPTFAMRVFDVPPGGASSDHSHEFEHEVLILRGEGVLKGAWGNAPFSEGSAILIQPNETHQLVNTGKDPLRFVCIVPLRGEDADCGLSGPSGRWRVIALIVVVVVIVGLLVWGFSTRGLAP